MPANAVGQAKLMAQADRIRGQARSYSRSAATARSWASATPVCGERKGAGTRKTCRSVACPAIGCEAVVNLTTPCLLTHRIHCVAAAARQIAGQATLLQWIGVGAGNLGCGQIDGRRTQNPTACAKPEGVSLLANAVGRYMFRRGSALAGYAPNRTQQGAWRRRTCSC